MNSDQPSTGHYFSRLRVLTQIIEGYEGKVPLHHYLKKFYSRHRQFGSKDRKLYSAWVYSYYRIRSMLPGKEVNTLLAAGYFLVHGQDDNFLKYVSSHSEFRLPEEMPSTLDDRILIVRKQFPGFSIMNAWDKLDEFSNGIDKHDFAQSILVQPLVFTRVIKKFEKEFIEGCKEKNIEAVPDLTIPLCYSFSPGTNLTSLEIFDTGYFEIQDRSSQIAGNSIQAGNNQAWWDCCAGAGGKSLQLLSIHENLQLTASDKRISILENFVKRLNKYSQKSKVRLLELDLENEIPANLQQGQFDGILADVPCTGSGTWSRSPEQIAYFKQEAVRDYVNRQKSILEHAVPFLKYRGHLAYITCSVFAAENEEVCNWISNHLGLVQVEAKSINGIDFRADSMFIAHFRKGSAG